MTTTSTCLERTPLAVADETPTEPLAVLAARAACAMEQSIQRLVLASDENLGHLERQAAQDVQALLRQAIQRGAQAKADATPPICPVCGHKLTRLSSGQARTFQTRFGSITVQRTRGYCKRCRKWRIPADAALGLEASAGYSPAVQDMAALLASKMPVEDASAVLEHLTGVKLPRATLDREARRQGERAQALRTQLDQQAATEKKQLELTLEPYQMIIQLDAWNIRERDGWGQSRLLRRKGQEPERWHWVYTGTCFRLDQRGQTAGGRPVITERGFVATRAGLEPCANNFTPRPCAVGVKLFAQGVQARPGSHKTAFGDDGTAPGGLATLVEPKTGARVNPVPPFGFLPLPAQKAALAPTIPFPNVPRIQLNDHLVGFQRQFQLFLFGGRLLIQLGAQGLGSFSLAPRFPVQCGAGKFNARQVFEDGAGVFDRHFAGQQCGHVLHGGRIAGARFQPQGGIGGNAPFAAAFAVATGALNGYGPKTRLKSTRLSAGKPGELVPAHRTNRRGRIGFGLRPALDRLSEQCLYILGGLAFQMTEVFITGQYQALNGLLHRTSGAGRQHGQRLSRRFIGYGERSAFKTGRGRCHARSLHYPARN